MAVTKEWNCLAHGAFDGPSLDDDSNPPCPHGCAPNMVVRAYRTFPSVQSAGYRSINASFEALARDQGVTNMNNRSAIQDGTGMRMTTPEQMKRLNHATELIMHASRSGQNGADASQYFKPLNEFTPGSTGEGGVLHRDGARVFSGSIELGAPKPALVAAPHDGSDAGLPAGET